MLSSPRSVPASLSPETDRPSLHPVASVAGVEAQPLWVSVCLAVEGQAPDRRHYKLSTASLCRLFPQACHLVQGDCPGPGPHRLMTRTSKCP